LEQAMPPNGPQQGQHQQTSDELAAMRHENASLKRRMAGFEQQIDQLKANQRDQPAAVDVRFQNTRQKKTALACVMCKKSTSQIFCVCQKR
jgi:hypothetical protein